MPATDGGASAADWIAAWAQVGAAIGTVMTLAAALWINRRTRLALDDERNTRQEEIARLEATRTEADIQKVKRTIEKLLIQLNLEWDALEHSANWIKPSTLLEVAINTETPGMIRWAVGQSDDWRDPLRWFIRLMRDEWIGRLARGVSVSLVVPRGSDMQVQIYLSELETTAHRDIYGAVEKVFDCHREFLGAHNAGWRGKRSAGWLKNLSTMPSRPLVF